MKAIVFVIGVVVVLSVGVYVGNAPELEGSEKPVITSEQFNSRLVEIAREYKSYGFADSTNAAWAPTMCSAPIAYKEFRPGEARLSESGDMETHGDKLYFLFARNRGEYVQKAKSQPMGQVIVKESWTSKESTEEERTDSIDSGRSESEGVPFARKGDKVYRTDKQAELFIMFKTSSEVVGTDNGWVYGTVASESKKVTSVGRVETCMRCHQSAKYDRLFGLPDDLATKPLQK